MSVTVLPEITVTAKRDPATGSGAPSSTITTNDPVASTGVPPATSAAPINDPSGPQTAIRQPLLKVIANGGQSLAGVVSAEVETNNYYATDHFHLTFAASAGEPGWFDYEGPLVLDTHFSLDQGHSWTSLLIGEVDRRVWNPETGTVTLEGRDLSARLIEMKIQEAFVNWTSSHVAIELAKRTDLIPVVTPTTTLIGRYYESDHVEGSLDQFARTTTAWDILIYLAQREGYDVFVEGINLHFQPTTPPNAAPFVIRWQPPGPIPRLNVVTLRAERSDTMSKDVQVQVRSWNSQQARAFTKTARAAGTKRPSASGTSSFGKGVTTQNYVVIRPNLTEDQAQQLANQLAIDLTKHERVIEVSMHGDLTLTPRHLVRLEGTQTSWDQLYQIDEIHRSLSFSDGFKQTLRLKNSSPRSMVQLS
jgi:hypothetical protein